MQSRSKELMTTLGGSASTSKRGAVLSDAGLTAAEGICGMPLPLGSSRNTTASRKNATVSMSQTKAERGGEAADSCLGGGVISMKPA